MKKGVIIAIVVIVLFFLLLPQILGQVFKSGISNDNPGQAAGAANACMALQQHKSALRMWQRIQQDFPQHEPATVHYKMAVCYEMSGEKVKAMGMYNTFASAYPEHRWKDQAVKRASNIEANQ